MESNVTKSDPFSCITVTLLKRVAKGGCDSPEATINWLGTQSAMPPSHPMDSSSH